jgi:hypothetical protein
VLLQSELDPVSSGGGQREKERGSTPVFSPLHDHDDRGDDTENQRASKRGDDEEEDVPRIVPVRFAPVMNPLIKLPDQGIVRLQLRGEVEKRIASHSDDCDPHDQDYDRYHERAAVRETLWAG